MKYIYVMFWVSWWLPTTMTVYVANQLGFFVRQPCKHDIERGYTLNFYGNCWQCPIKRKFYTPVKDNPHRTEDNKLRWS